MENLLNIDLESKREKLTSLAYELFDNIQKVPVEIRQDDKLRTGIMVLIKRAYTRNPLMIEVYKPSDGAKFFVTEKAVRSAMLKHVTSQNSEDPGQFQYAGSITVTPEVGVHYQVSVSGMQAPEDVGCAVRIMAELLNWQVSNVLYNIREKGGKLPAFFKDPNHYMQPIIGY